MAHQIGLATYDSFLHAWVLDLPGCVAGCRDMEEVGHMLPLAIAEHDAWLRGHGEGGDGGVAWEIAEVVDARAFAATGGEFCFAAERAPLTRPALERAIARMGYARADLLAAIDQLPDAILDWMPPRSAVAAFDPWETEPRTVRGIVRHVLQLEAYYRGSLRDGPAAGIFEEVGDPSVERSRTLEILRSLSDAKRGRVYHPTRPARDVPEDWTVRKVLRRIISHERAHAAEVLQRRTWVLLGVPRLSTE